ncbi:Mutual gliding-motility protein MglA [Geobacteraceae bacterium]|nr:Mutual gliding-motility protein MglA [Geobacteraceae bacterium]
MALFNRTKREINAKIVYFGPPLAGKATTLHFIHRKLKPEYRGAMKTMGGQMDRMLFFDFMPPELGEVNDHRVRFHLYTVQGEVTNPSTWKTVLKGADGVVFIADASPESRTVTRDSMESLRGYLQSYGQELEKLPCVIQCNKSDLPDALSPEEVARVIASAGFPAVKASSRTGEGVLQVLSTVVKRIMKELREQGHDGERDGMFAAFPVQAVPVMPSDDESEPVGREGEKVTTDAETIEGAAEALSDAVPTLALGGRVAVTPDGSLRVPLTARCGGVEKGFVLSISLAPETPSVA